MSEKSNGQVAYEGYCEHTGWKSLVSGQPLPAWDEAPDPLLEEAWEAAAEAVLAAQPKPKVKCGWCAETATNQIQFKSNRGVRAAAYCCRRHVGDGAKLAEAATA